MAAGEASFCLACVCFLITYAELGKQTSVAGDLLCHVNGVGKLLLRLSFCSALVVSRLVTIVPRLRKVARLIAITPRLMVALLLIAPRLGAMLLLLLTVARLLGARLLVVLGLWTKRGVRVGQQLPSP
ncbi:uncharacterized protein J3D65DRAFT_101275 [Phyllosticta citribraziliensis]|uniref:Uncharacterized protein n=1 Tax=Phyllosticta citribraziliensis TaxID=989973 RepID=A0ABR1LAM1_9PEZI